MKTLKIVIEKSSDSFGAYALDVEGIYGAGDTLAQVKQSINDAIETIKTFDEKDIPEILKGDIKLVFVFETQSFLEYFDSIFTRAALSRLTGINEKQLGHYMQGLHKPRKDKAEKIEKALHNLGEELLAVELV